MAAILEGFGGTPEEASRAVALLKSLSHEGRLQILCLLVDGDMSVGQLAGALGTSPVSVSQLLMRLRAEGIVQTRREGKNVIYHLARDEVARIVTTLRDTFCKRAPPVKR
jgi:DNA-binding transcriptional ArsR family regulator